MRDRIKYVLGAASALAVVIVTVGSSAEQSAIIKPGCTRNSECQSPLVCRPLAGGGGNWCTQECFVDRDCGPTAHCVQVPTGTGNYTAGACTPNQVNKRELCGTEKMTCVFSRDCKSGSCTNGLCN